MTDSSSQQLIPLRSEDLNGLIVFLRDILPRLRIFADLNHCVDSTKNSVRHCERDQYIYNYKVPGSTTQHRVDFVVQFFIHVWIPTNEVDSLYKAIGDIANIFRLMLHS